VVGTGAENFLVGLLVVDFPGADYYLDYFELEIDYLYFEY